MADEDGPAWLYNCDGVLFSGLLSSGVFCVSMKIVDKYGQAWLFNFGVVLSSGIFLGISRFSFSICHWTVREGAKRWPGKLF